ncbi:C-mannosyltransferase dpy-19 family protein [Puniceicoccaceae bacterium K14]|nr:C-mannosyltransferase dpy-19 family protein [Puniceicoccaceae bacterium K14]
MPYYADILMAWATSFYPTGYALTALPQFLGGLLLLVSVKELCKILKFCEFDSWATVAFCLMMPNVLLQFSTTQTDLITAGFFNLGIVFLWRYFEKNVFVYGFAAALTLGLAIGTKSTILYWVPGIFTWVLFAIKIKTPNLSQRICGLLSIGLMSAILGCPNYIHNTFEFGNPFASQNDIDRIHFDVPLDEIPEYSSFIAKQHIWQTLQRQSNPWPIETLLYNLSQPLKQNLESAPPSEYFSESFDMIVELLGANHTYVDIVTFGFIPVLLTLVALISLFFLKVPNKHKAASILVALTVFFTFFFTKQTPNPWNFRFFILLTPFVSVFCIWGLQFIGKYKGHIVAIILLLSVINTYETLKNDVLSSFKALINPQAHISIIIHGEIESAIHSLKSATRIGVLMPYNSVLSPFFRTSSKAEIILLNSQEIPKTEPGMGLWLLEKGIDGLITQEGHFSPEGLAWEPIEQSRITSLSEYHLDLYIPSNLNKK